MTSELYNEILSSDKTDLYSNEFYSVPLVIEDIVYILNLLKGEHNYKLHSEICTFLSDEYDLIID